MKKIYLKEWVKPMAELHATCVVEDELGILDNESPEYKREFEKAFTEFCEELYTHSLTPMIASNPTVVKGVNAFIAFYNDLLPNIPLERSKSPMFIAKLEEAWKKDTSWFKQNYPNASAEEIAEKARQLKRAVGTIMQIFVSSKYGKKDFLYPAVGSMDNEKRKIENKMIEIRRFYRLFIVSVILGNIKNLYSIDSNKLFSSLQTMLESYSSGELRKKDFNIKFSQVVKKFITESGTKDIVTEFLKFASKLS